MLPVNASAIYYAIATLIAVGGLVWKLSAAISALKTSVHTIESNHLTHIESDIKEIKQWIQIIVGRALDAKEDK